MTIYDVLEFLKTYYKEIIEISILFISVVICLVRKRPCVNEIDIIKEDVLEKLPSFISVVESPGNGAQKKKAVIDLVSLYVRKTYKISIPDSLVPFLENAIESILSTPTKKKGE